MEKHMVEERQTGQLTYKLGKSSETVFWQLFGDYNQSKFFKTSVNAIST
jgi:hypothetical protein